MTNPNFPESITVRDPILDPDTPKYLESDFPELGWLSEGTFVKTVVEEGSTCCYFELSKEKESAGRVLRAWINAETKLPVKYDNGENVFKFTKYAATVPREIVVPPEFKTWLDEAARNRRVRAE